MSVLRNMLLAGSESPWLREQASRRRFVRRAVARFMPGESLDEALVAAQQLRQRGMSVILTNLGENVRDRSEAEAEVRHYCEVLRRLQGSGLDAEVSVKLTHLGLDLDLDFTLGNVLRIAGAAAGLGSRLWIDMEGTAYTDRSIQLFRRARAERANVGLCLQGYLRRSVADLESLLPLAPAIRVVKGAYREPATLAFQRMAETNESFARMCRILLAPEARRAGAWLAVGTHDPVLLAQVEAHAREAGVGGKDFEFALLYGIRRDEQARLVNAGHRVRVLVSYGAYWFPWYMRRLAERPANLWFVARSAFAR
jgi:proline dehydrogenase